MNHFFDEESQKIIIKAKKEMLDLKHPYVGSEHLLLAVLNTPSLKITKVLMQYHISYDKFRGKLIECVGVGTKDNQWFLMTPMLKKIIMNASHFSDNSEITPFQLIVSLFQIGDGIAIRVLLSMGYDLDALYQNLIYLNSFMFSSNRNLSLDEYAINMNKQAQNQLYDPVIGRNKQIDQIIRILLRKNKNNPLLIGEPGVGKTAVIEELSRLLVSSKVPEKLKGTVIYNLQISNLVAGTRYRGEFEEKLHHIIDEIKNNPNIILFIDEFHTIIGAGGSDGAIDASNILKPYLSRGEIKIIGATTFDEYHKWIEKDKAFDRRFQKVCIEEVNDEEVKVILSNLKSIYEKYHRVVLSDDILDKILSYSNSYIFNGQQPDKAIDLLDDVCTFCASKPKIIDNKLEDYSTRIYKTIKNKNKMILDGNFKSALLFKRKERELENLYNDIMFTKENNSFSSVEEKDIVESIYLKNKIPLGNYLEDIVSKAAIQLKKIVFGQNEIINSLCNNIVDSNYLSFNKCLSFLLVGKSGLGKTFFAQEFSKLLVGQDYYYFQLRDYLDENSFFQKFGYHMDKNIMPSTDYLLKGVMTRPFSILLFDDIQSISDSIFKFVLKILNDGYYIDSFGKKIILSKCIIFFICDNEKSSIGFVSNNSLNNVLVLKEKVYSVFFFQNLSKSYVRRLLLSYGKKYHLNSEEINHFILNYSIYHESLNYGDILQEFQKKFFFSKIKS